MAVIYDTISSVHAHEFVSRRTTATVDMHCIASTKKTIRVRAVSGVHTLAPLSFFASRMAEMSVGDSSVSSFQC